MAKIKHEKDKREVRKHLAQIEEMYKLELATTTNHYNAFDKAIHKVYYSIQALQNNFNFAWFKQLVKSQTNYVVIDKKLQKEANKKKKQESMTKHSIISQLTFAL